MKAIEHTQAMLAAWSEVGVGRADLAVRCPDGKMLWQRNRDVEDLPLAWLRGANAHGSEIYIRPARGFDWPVVFLDDVPVRIAMAAVARHGGLAVCTSPTGGCHLWLPCPRPLDEVGRCRAQRILAEQFGADPASTSGEHLGRLAGFKNWKRGGCWVNVLGWVKATGGERQVLDIPRDSPGSGTTRPSIPMTLGKASRPCSAGHDTSPSGREWAWVCSRLERGADPETVCLELSHMARGRRGEDAVRYARRTVERAWNKVGRSMR